MTNKKRKLKQKLLDKYRLVILNDNTFEEKISFNLTRLNVFVFFGFSAIVLIGLTALLIAFTPLREYIPGYSSTQLKKDAKSLAEKADSLEMALKIQKRQLNSIRKVLVGDVFPTKEEEQVDSTSGKKFESLPTSVSDSLLREEVAREDKYNLFEKDEANNFVLFPPVKGSITEPYNAKEKHYAVDIVVAEGTPIKSVADGTIIFSEWTAETGYVIIVEHANNLLSVYKHNQSLNKSQGDLVKSGEVIAFSGSGGSLSTGPHLHFELWSNGYALNPTQFIAF
ncbi:murein hydrolase activator EnvC family protein [Pseudofulvibacter geojedonensis]|uniref:Murein hydrolase activator EnvC family protein n=1 Tax=Pseudofulvibacter geojedonensis TaxID=1123758 RepID=A0ABW3I5E8_9FLAO